jgi:hypothetical protein
VLIENAGANLQSGAAEMGGALGSPASRRHMIKKILSVALDCESWSGRRKALLIGATRAPIELLATTRAQSILFID